MSVQALRAQFEKSKHEAISKSAHSIYNPVTQTFQSMPQPRHVQKEAFALSVKQLTLIFEQLSQQYGTLSGSSNWIEMVRNHVKKGDYYQRGIIDVQKVVADIAKDTGLIKTGKSARISDAVSVTIPDRFEKCKDEAKPELELAPAAQPDSMQLISTSTIESGPQGNGTLMEKILPKTITRPKKHACDMIVCGIVTKTVNGHRVHEIDLKCHGCESQFVLSAAHECEADEEQTLEKGLEWLSDGKKSKKTPIANPIDLGSYEPILS